MSEIMLFLSPYILELGPIFALYLPYMPIFTAIALYFDVTLLAGLFCQILEYEHNTYMIRLMHVSSDVI